MTLDDKKMQLKKLYLGSTREAMEDIVTSINNDMRGLNDYVENRIILMTTDQLRMQTVHPPKNVVAVFCMNNTEIPPLSLGKVTPGSWDFDKDENVVRIPIYRRRGVIRWVMTRNKKLEAFQAFPKKERV